jgi:hypothetical protein
MSLETLTVDLIVAPQLKGFFLRKKKKDYKAYFLLISFVRLILSVGYLSSLAHIQFSFGNKGECIIKSSANLCSIQVQNLNPNDISQ